MGWAARVTQQQQASGEQRLVGNPTPYVPTATCISQVKATRARRRGQRLVAKFSDRSYEIRADGSLRRLPAGVSV